MKKVLIILLLARVSVNLFGLDWFGLFYDEPKLNTEYTIEGSVVMVFPHDAWWIVGLHTSAWNGYFYTSGAVYIIYTSRPLWVTEPGQLVEVDCAYNGVWFDECITFRGIIHEDD